ncbi:MAG TPA: TonB-dependent receptor [Opitutus sp.]|nr:TonB-dependent receptor [Opitutus sp.]
MTFRLFSRRWILPAVTLLPLAAQAELRSIDAMKSMSLEELLDVQVTTMSRKEELWWKAPGAIEVLTQEEIRRSGARNLPEALRLATGVDVAQPFARGWAISARGFNVLAANKISVLMDGRSLFTPFFSGVQWDAQDTLMQDIDRIEVVRGPVGALWGSFAVNGFIQVVTKSAEDTQGTLVSTGTGTADPVFVSARHGGRVGRATYYRAYAKYFQSDWTYLADGSSGGPQTDFGQAGFRTDTRLDADTALTLQGDAYTNKGLPLDHPQIEISGANVLGRLRRTLGGSAELEAMTYVDYTHRLIPGTWEEKRRTGGLSAKFRQQKGSHDWLVGVDAVVSRDDIAQQSIATMDPPRRTTHTAGMFVQDTLALVPGRLALTGGAKVEHNNFSGVEFAPSVRAGYTPTGRTTFWGAVSRAVRAPVRIDQDLRFELGNTTVFEATGDYAAETVIAYEAGWRQRFGDATLDLATFYNDYDRLRTIEPLGAAAVPLTYKNGLRTRSAGAEVTAMYQPVSRLFFKLSYRYLDLDFLERPGTRDTAHGIFEGNDPRHLFTLSAHVELPWSLEFDAALRHVSERPNPATAAQTAADLRLGWRPNETWEVSLIGRNLFNGPHQELVTPDSLNQFVKPSGAVGVTWRY